MKLRVREAHILPTSLTVSAHTSQTFDWNIPGNSQVHSHKLNPFVLTYLLRPLYSFWSIGHRWNISNHVFLKPFSPAGSTSVTSSFLALHFYSRCFWAFQCLFCPVGSILKPVWLLLLCFFWVCDQFRSISSSSAGFAWFFCWVCVMLFG